MGSKVATCDFETRSVCSLPDSGTYRYSLDPSTEVLCLSYALPDWPDDRVELWHPNLPQVGLAEDGETLVPLLEHIAAGGEIEAHNAMFERAIWNNVMVPRYRVLPIQSDRWRCSAAKAAAHALPRNLENAIESLGLTEHKDVEGGTVIRKVSIPRKPIKADVQAWMIQHAPCSWCGGAKRIPSFKKNGEPTVRGQKCPDCQGKGFDADRPVPDMPILWHETPEQYATLFAYNKQDVRAERALSRALPDLTPDEQRLYTLDQEINERGFMLDPDAIDTAMTLIDQEFVGLNAELRELTGGVVERATQRKRMMAWFSDQGLELEDTQALTVEAILADTTLEIAPAARRGLELMKELGKSSTAKYETMRDWLGPDNRVRGGLLFDGASTGRWTGKGVQPHNFPKGTIKDMVLVWDTLKTLNRDRIVALPKDKQGTPYGNVMDVLSHALRGVIVPTPGNQLYVADYAAIEARVVLWLADDIDALDVFFRGDDIYLEMASAIYGHACTKDEHPRERALGKIAVLGLGYQMGWRKFIESCANFGITIDDEFAQRVVEAYRRKFYLVKEMWWAYEDAAIQATLWPGERHYSGKVSWIVEGRFLYCELPSGRRLAYADPEVHERMTPWGAPKPQLSFMGVNSYTHQWDRQTTYGGSLVENVTQAVARDVMADALLRIASGLTYTPVLTVHDEVIAEAPLGTGSVSEFEGLLTVNPSWAEGLPIGAEGWAGPRYRK